MLYLNEKNLKYIGIDWNEIIGTVEKAVKCLKSNEYVQPIKPYLRYRDLKNRIIAMPAFVGGDIDTSGIKWIASFPDNISNGIPRAHSVLVLNNSSTGQPIGIVNGALLSILRTAGVSGLIIKYFDKVRSLRNINVGIIGWGPIGQYHLKVCEALLGDRIAKVFLYDIRPVLVKENIEFFDKDKIYIVNNWEDAYDLSDIFITCTVSKEPYINKAPKKGALLLNVSLRDYKTNIYGYVKNSIIVDDWDEICREKTDIEMMYMEKGLKREETKSIVDVVCNDVIKEISSDEAIMFNPMGMAVFDIALGSYYIEKAQEKGIGKMLD